MDQPIIPLDCEVHVYKLRQSDPSYLKLQQLAFWEDMRSSAMPKHFGWGQVISCRIPKGFLPPEQMVHQWVNALVKADPSGVIGSFHGPLYDYAMYYTKEAYQPLVSSMNLLCLGEGFLTRSSMS
jgi:hypothetical protein